MRKCEMDGRSLLVVAALHAFRAIAVRPARPGHPISPAFGLFRFRISRGRGSSSPASAGSDNATTASTPAGPAKTLAPYGTGSCGRRFLRGMVAHELLNPLCRFWPNTPAAAEITNEFRVAKRVPAEGCGVHSFLDKEGFNSR